MLKRVLIAGLGSIGTRHVRLVRELVPSAEVIALRHLNYSGSLPAGIDRCVSSIGEALKYHPEAAVVATPASYHLNVAMPLASAGVHLLVEKPISHVALGVSDLIDACRAKGVILMTGYNLRFSPSLQQFRELLQIKRVGAVLSVRAEVGSFLPLWRPNADYRQTVSAKGALGGGVLLELSHEIDYLRWLFGEVEWVSAIQRKQSGLEMDAEDIAHLVMCYASSAKSKSVIATLTMDCFRHDITRCCTVIGERGSLRWNALSGTVEVFEEGASTWQTVFTHQSQRDDTYVSQWNHFLACIAGHDSPMVSGDDGLAVLRVIEAARLSSAKGSVVHLQIHNEGGEGPRTRP